MTLDRKAISGFHLQLCAQLVVLLLICLPVFTLLHHRPGQARPCTDSSKPLVYGAEKDCGICDFLAHFQKAQFLPSVSGQDQLMLFPGVPVYASFAEGGFAGAAKEHANKGPPAP